MKEIDSEIEEILDAFDFEKVASIMQLLNWTWYNEEAPPSVTRLVLCALELLTQAKAAQRGGIATGGFMAGHEDGYLFLRFSADVESYSELKQEEF